MYAGRSRLPLIMLTRNADDEANSSDRSTEEFTWTEAEETAVRRKLDRVIVPLTTFLYLLCFLDRYGFCLNMDENHTDSAQNECRQCQNPRDGSGSKIGWVPVQLGHLHILYDIYGR